VSKASISGRTPRSVIILRHGAQHGRRVGHDIVAEEKFMVPQSSVQISGRHSATWLTRSVAPAMSVPFGLSGKGAFDIPEDHVAAHAGGQVQDDVDIRRADAVGDFPVEIVAAAGGPGFRIADMAVDDAAPALAASIAESAICLGERGTWRDLRSYRRSRSRRR
jgi:hypothetical protein